MKQDVVGKLFLAELKRRGMRDVVPQPDGSFAVRILGTQYTVSLDNVRKSGTRGEAPELIARFVDGVLATRVELPPWPEAALGIRYAAEPPDHRFGDTLHEVVTPAMVRVLVFTDAEETRVSWLSQSHLDRWGVLRHVLEAQASSNMDLLLSATTLELQEAAGSQLAMFSTHSVFKASMIFSPSLKAFISKLGWPLLVVAPCRDFLYAFTDTELIPRLARVVMREFKESGYPVTPEVLRIADSGITALGAFGA